MTESRRDGGGPIVAVVLIALALLAMLLTGCAVGPDYKRPDVDLPKDYGVAQAPTPAAERWWSVFGDPTLERLIDEALAANRDLRAAAERVEQSRAQLMVARAALWPDAGIQKALELQKLRLDAGAVSEVEYRQVESDLRGTAALVPVARQARVAQEGALAVLLGRSPREVYEAKLDRGSPAVPMVVEVPAGLPSDLLLRRPDLRQAEAQLQAATARIGVARAAYFPSIKLTGNYGGGGQPPGRPAR